MTFAGQGELRVRRDVRETVEHNGFYNFFHLVYLHDLDAVGLAEETGYYGPANAADPEERVWRVSRLADPAVVPAGEGNPCLPNLIRNALERLAYEDRAEIKYQSLRDISWKFPKNAYHLRIQVPRVGNPDAYVRNMMRRLDRWARQEEKRLATSDGG